MTLQTSIKSENKIQSRHYIEKKVYQKLIEDYNPTDKDYESTIIKSIIFNESCHIVALFKEYLLLDDNSEFLKRYYSNEESNHRLVKLIDYYENYSKIYPNYNVIIEGKYFYRNIQKKQRMIDLQEEMEKDEKVKNPLSTSIDLFNTEVYESIINDKNNEDIETMFGKPESNQNETDIIQPLERIINEIEINKVRLNDYNNDNEVNDGNKTNNYLNNNNVDKAKNYNSNNPGIKLANNTVIVTNIKKRNISSVLLENKLIENGKRTNGQSNESKGKTDRIVLDKIDLNTFINKSSYNKNNSGNISIHNNSNNNSANIKKNIKKIDLRFSYILKEPMTFRFHHSNIISAVNKSTNYLHPPNLQQKNIRHQQQSCNTSRIQRTNNIPFQNQINGRNISSRNIDTIINSKINRSTLNGSMNNILNHSQFKTKQRNDSKNQTKNSLFESNSDNYLIKFSKDSLLINNINNEHKINYNNHQYNHSNISSRYQMINKEQFSLGKFIQKTMKMINSSGKITNSKSRDIKKSIEETSKLGIEHNSASSTRKNINRIHQKVFYPKKHCNISNAIKTIQINNFNKAFEFQSSMFSNSERARKGSCEIDHHYSHQKKEY